MKCVDIPVDNPPEGDWYCQHACRRLCSKKGKSKGKSNQQDPPNASDFVYNYSRAITWAGLNLLCRRDAVREADGDALMKFWKLDLIHFFRTKHPKYLILAHRLIVSINGWLPKRLQEDLVWNRTVNYGGGIGRNLPMDIMNEILNRLFKDLLTAAKGRYTQSTIQRCGQIVGPLGESLDVVFDSQVIEHALYRHRRRSQNRDKNVHHLVEFLQEDDLFGLHLGRYHRAFPEFNHCETPKLAGQLSSKLKQLSKRIDRKRGIVLNQ